MVVLDQNLPIIPAAMQAASDPFASVLNPHARTAPAKCVGARAFPGGIESGGFPSALT
jgi:hypothetical protein